MRGVVIAGTGSGAGKTSIATGLMRKLSRTMNVQGFKVGPDFIDPMFHKAATGRHSRNLDSFMMTKDVVKNLAAYGSKDADISIVEGVRGLFEGQSGTDESGSTAEIAKLLGLPVVLVVNARSLTRSAAAIVNGFRSYDKELNIAGVILNNISGAQHEGKLKEAMRDSNIRVLGAVRRGADLMIHERHLGLDTEELSDKSVINGMESMAEGVDIDQLMDVCGGQNGDKACFPYVERNSGLTAAIPMDDAFCFYYRENIECMMASGIKVKHFSPLKGDPLPDADIYYLGGGYPELHMEQLSENRDLFQGLKTACDDGKVIIGECGGMLMMCTSIKTGGSSYKTAGIFNAEADMIGRRHGPVYVIARANSRCRLFEGTVRGHEFHYTTVHLGPGCEFGFDVLRGSDMNRGRDGMVQRNAFGTYMHQHALSAEDWMGRIAGMCK